MWDVNSALNLFTVCVGLSEKALGIKICSFLHRSDFFSFDFLISCPMSFDYGPVFDRDVFLKVF